MSENEAVPAAVKKQKLLSLLELGMTMLHFDPRRAGVDVPAPFRSQRDMRINVSYRFRLPEFVIDSAGVVATLSFPSVGNYRCVIPWAALFGITSQTTDDGVMWVEEMPWESRLELTRNAMMLLHRSAEHNTGFSIDPRPQSEPAAPTSPTPVDGSSPPTPTRKKRASRKPRHNLLDETPPPMPAVEPDPPRLQVIRGGQGSDAEDPAGPPSGGVTRRGHLRLLK